MSLSIAPVSTTTDTASAALHAWIDRAYGRGRVTLSKVSAPRVSLRKPTDALESLSAAVPSVIREDLARNDLDALHSVFVVGEVRRIMALEDDLLRLDQAPNNSVYVITAEDGLDALTRGRYRSTTN